VGEKIMDRFFDRLMESKWFVRILALLVALLLYTTAYIDEKVERPASANHDSSAVIEDVPVQLFYDEENYVVTSSPQTVTVLIEGPSSIVRTTENLRNFNVYLDLYDADIGTQEVEFQIEDISDKLTVQIEPTKATVNMQEKVTKEFPVEVQFNTSLLEEGYTAGEPMVEPDTVTVTGGKDVVDRISYILAIIEHEGGIKKDLTQRATLTVLDQNLDKLNVDVEPEQVKVKVPVQSPEKTVSINLEQKGSPPPNVKIESIQSQTKEVVIYGKQSTLEKITNLTVPIDVSEITESQEVTVPIPLQDDIFAIKPETITVQIEVEKMNSRTFENIPIGYIGLNDNYALSFLDPENGQVDLTVMGQEKALQNLKKDDFDVTINVEGLDIGEHDLDINVTGPENVSWELKQNKVKVAINEISTEE
jgi:YbbR domain-containing protein